MKEIINFLIEKRGYHFKGFRKNFIEDLIIERMEAHRLNRSADYLNFLQEDQNELSELIHRLIIPVSRFFRNPVIFEVLGCRILPPLLTRKKSQRERDFRIWSAGCSTGEEPYSLAILLKELFKHEQNSFTVENFATDINIQALEFARKGIYRYDSIKNTRYEWLKRYFTQQDEYFILQPEIRDSVLFSYHDLRDEKNIVPPDSIFGYFDLVFCRNLLIYYELETQKQMISHLENSLITGGYLVLGESESIYFQGNSHLKRMENFCSIYQKI